MCLDLAHLSLKFSAKARRSLQRKRVLVVERSQELNLSFNLLFLKFHPNYKLI